MRLESNLNIASVASSLPEINVAYSSLPSKGLLYPKGGVVKYRPYTFGEIKKISGSKLSNQAKIELILNGIETSFDKYMLTVPDFYFLALLRRISTTKDNKFVVNFKCKSCETDNKVVKSISDLEYKDIGAEKLPIELDLDGMLYRFAPITLKKFIEISETQVDEEDRDLVLLASLFVDYSLPVALELINNMPYYFIEDIRAIDAMLDHDVVPLKLNCNKCNAEHEIALDGGDDAVVLPFRGA